MHSLNKFIHLAYLAAANVPLGWDSLQTVAVTIFNCASILSSLSLSPTSSPSFRKHFGILCQQVVFALTGRHVRMCTEVRAEYNVSRHMPKYGIKMIVEPKLWNSLGRAWAPLSNFIFRLKKTKTDQWMVILIVIPNSYQKTLPTR